MPRGFCRKSRYGSLLTYFPSTLSMYRIAELQHKGYGAPGALRWLLPSQSNHSTHSPKYLQSKLPVLPLTLPKTYLSLGFPVTLLEASIPPFSYDTAPRPAVQYLRPSNMLSLGDSAKHGAGARLANATTVARRSRAQKCCLIGESARCLRGL